jgi:transposase
MNIKIISDEEKEVLENAYRAEKNAKVKIRILALMCLHIDRVSLQETAKLLRISIGSVQEYKRKYEQGKLKKLRYIACSSGRPSSLTQAQQIELKSTVSEGYYLNANAICSHVSKVYDVSYTANAMTKLLKRLGFVHKKPKTVPGKANAEKQAIFLKEVLTPLLDEASDTSPVYFEDAVHMLHNSQAAYGWVLKGKTKELRQNTGRKRININGAFCFHNQTVIYREDDRINAESCIALLTDIRAQHTADIRIKIVLDNARYNYATLVRTYAEENNIDLVFLPPYSPNLNLIERLWGRLKRIVTHNHYYEHFLDFYDAVMAFFETIPKQKNDLKKLLSPNFNIIGVSC